MPHSSRKSRRRTPVLQPCARLRTSSRTKFTIIRCRPMVLWTSTISKARRDHSATTWTIWIILDNLISTASSPTNLMTSSRIGLVIMASKATTITSSKGISWNIIRVSFHLTWCTRHISMAILTHHKLVKCLIRHRWAQSIPSRATHTLCTPNMGNNLVQRLKSVPSSKIKFTKWNPKRLRTPK